MESTNPSPLIMIMQILLEKHHLKKKPHYKSQRFTSVSRMISPNHPILIKPMEKVYIEK